MRPWERPGVDEVAKLLHGNESVVFVAPTGYGKSKSVPRILEEATRAGIAERVIHVLPLRALVEQQYWFLRGELGSAAGYLAGLRLGGDDYSGFMLRRAVVSTLDSFSLNLSRLSVAELGGVLSGVFEGHYELPRAAIFTSVTVLDEAHLYAEPWAEKEPLSRRFMDVALRVLSGSRVPLVVETATMPSSLLARVVNNTGARVVAVCRDCCKKYGLHGCHGVLDRVYEEEHDLRWITVLEKDKVSALDTGLSYAERGRRVLVVANTVRGAIQAYEYIVGKMGCPRDVVLVHGRLGRRDREKALEAMKKAKVIVATQVIEAGVDVDAEILVTEAAAPSSLAQRAGRLCRSKETLAKCQSEPPLVVIYPPGDRPYGESAREAYKEAKRILEKGARIEWRLLDDTRRCQVVYKSFASLVESIEGRRALGRTSHRGPGYELLAYLAMSSVLGSPGPAKKLVESFCSLVRDTGLVSLAIPQGDGKGYDVLETSLSLIQVMGGEKLLWCDNGACKVLVQGYGNVPVEAVIEVTRDRLVKALSSCRDYVRSYPRIVAEASKEAGIRGAQVLPLVKPGRYRSGIGLV